MRNLLIFAPDRARRTGCLLALTVFGTASLAGCKSDSPFTQPATVENETRSATVYAITGTAPGLPAAYQLSQERFVRPSVLFDGSLNFELAFDIDAQGHVLLMPARTVVPQPPSTAPVVGLLKLTAVFDQLTIAPNKGYVRDTIAIASKGDTWLVQLVTAGCIYGDPFYAKIAIDDVNLVDRSITVRTLANRNCGYRSLEAGLPTK
jgi:hypothetical protein